MNLPDALDVRTGDLVALVGGGGKTSLLLARGAAWPGGCVMTTTTRLGRYQLRRVPAWLLRSDGAAALARMVAAHGRCLVVENVRGDKALGVPPKQPGRWLARPDVDLVVVEADGSRRRPVKAPAPHEPALPPAVTLVVVMAGIDALAGPIQAVAHRPERVGAITGLAPQETLTPETLARLLTHPDGGLKGIPAAARVVVCLNKVETAAQQALAREVATHVLIEPRVERVVLAALGTDQPVRHLIPSPPSSGERVRVRGASGRHRQHMANVKDPSPCPLP